LADSEAGKRCRISEIRDDSSDDGGISRRSGKSITGADSFFSAEITRTGQSNMMPKAIAAENAFTFHLG
jgi:hypothetical protein